LVRAPSQVTDMGRPILHRSNLRCWGIAILGLSLEAQAAESNRGDAPSESVAVSADGSLSYQRSGGGFSVLSVASSEVEDWQFNEGPLATATEDAEAVVALRSGADDRPIPISVSREDTVWNSRVRTVIAFGCLLGVAKFWVRLQVEEDQLLNAEHDAGS